jgi:hypothetical protein
MKTIKILFAAALTVFLIVCFTACDEKLSTQYSIISIPGPHGTINPAGLVTLDEGSSQEYTITPDQGCQIQDVLVDGISVGAVSSYTLVNVTANHIILALFDTTIINVAGSWSGPLTIEGESGYELSANITQTGTDLEGTAGISYDGTPLTTYTVSATLSDTTITGQLIGASEEFYDIDIEATVNTEGTSMDGTFYIPDSGASGTFSMTKS